MRFVSVGHALDWLARHQCDGLHVGGWPAPERVSVSRRPAPEQGHLVALAIEAALAGLPAHERRLVVAHYLQDMPVLILAAERNRSASTIYAHLTRARRALAAALRREDLLIEPGT